MNLPQESKGRMLMIELIGLSITALLLFVIACSLQLALRVLSGGVMQAQPGVLAFGFLFYVCAAFVAAGTRQRPDHAHSLLANLFVRAGFLGVGFVLWRHAVLPSWFALAFGLVLLVHGGSFGFALLRRRALNALLHQVLLARGTARFDRVVIHDTFVERFFRVGSPTYRAIPIGGALGTLFGAMVTRDEGALLRHAWAGVFAALALAELAPLLTGALALAGSLTRRLNESDALARAQDEPEVTVRAIGSAGRKELRVFAPANGPGKFAAKVAPITTALRRVLLVNQLQRASAASLALVAIGHLEFSRVPATQLLLPLLTGAIAFTIVPYVIGQRTR